MQSSPVHRYGCNLVQPRIFQETTALYSEQMTGVFSGGLIYEFTQSTAKYGLVEVAKNNKDVSCLDEFDNLQAVQEKLPDNPTIPSDAKENTRPNCRDPNDYAHIAGPLEIPTSFGVDYIKKGVASAGSVKWKKGKFLDIKKCLAETSYTIKDSSGKEIKDKTIDFSTSVDQKTVPDGGNGVETGGGDGTQNTVEDTPSGSNSSSSDSGKKNAALPLQATVGTVFAVAVAAIFATL